jgi:hypothetical protein
MVPGAEAGKGVSDAASTLVLELQELAHAHRESTVLALITMVHGEQSLYYMCAQYIFTDKN